MIITFYSGENDFTPGVFNFQARYFDKFGANCVIFTILLIDWNFVYYSHTYQIEVGGQQSEGEFGRCALEGE